MVGNQTKTLLVLIPEMASEIGVPKIGAIKALLRSRSRNNDQSKVRLV
jgi:hypothetical protein